MTSPHNQNHQLAMLLLAKNVCIRCGRLECWVRMLQLY
jgi:hypothetical protein